MTSTSFRSPIEPGIITFTGGLYCTMCTADQKDKVTSLFPNQIAFQFCVRLFLVTHANSYVMCFYLDGSVKTW